MAGIPARENFKNTKTSKTSQISLGPREKLLGRAGLVWYIFFPKSENGFECDFSRVKVSGFPSGDRRSQSKNVANFDPRNGSFNIIFGLREENL
jgi:hypothetical protein